jgi:hypothetical protein
MLNIQVIFVSMLSNNLDRVEGAFELSSSLAARQAWKDLEGLGYDIKALSRRNMSDDQIVELRDKAFRYRGIRRESDHPY